MKCFAICSLFSLLTLGAWGQAKVQKMAIGGSYAPNIVIVDWATGAVEWSYRLPVEAECNSVSVLPDGSVLFSYKQGVKRVDRAKNVIFDYKVGSGQEAQSASVAGDRVVVGICGTPARIVELDMEGKVVSEVNVELNIPEPHSQFRQVAKRANGNYLIPIISQSKIIEVSTNGNVVKEYPTLGSPFSVAEVKNGNLMVSAGCKVSEIDRSGKSKVIAGPVVGVDTIRFATQALQMPRGGYAITNWTGHDAGVSDASIIEINAKGDVVRRFCDTVAMKYVSAIFLFETK